MPLTIACSNCAKQYTIADSFAGRALKCKACGGRIDVPSTGTDDDDGWGLSGDSAFDAPAPALQAHRAAPSTPALKPPKAYAAARKSGGPLFDLGGHEETVALLLIAASVLPTIGLRVYHGLGTGLMVPNLLLLVAQLAIVVVVIIPLALLGIWIAGKVLKFGLPEHPLLYLTACFFTPGAALYCGYLLGDRVGAGVGLLVGLLATFFVFIALFRIGIGQAALAYLFGAIAVLPGLVIAGFAFRFAGAGIASMFEDDFREYAEANGQPDPFAARPPALSRGEASSARDPITPRLEADRQRREAQAELRRQQQEQRDRAERERQERQAEFERQRLRALEQARAGLPSTMTPPVAPASTPFPGSSVTPPSARPSGTVVPTAPPEPPPPILVPSDAVAASAVWSVERGTDVFPVAYPSRDLDHVLHVVGRGADHTLVLNDPQTLEQASEVKLPTGAVKDTRYALSPSGEKLARLVDFPRLQLQVLSTASGEPLHAIDLDPTGDKPHVAGFVGEDRVMVRRQSAFWRGVQIFDLPKEQLLIQQELPKPDLSDETLLIHPEGQQFIVFSDEGADSAVEALHMFRGSGSKMRFVRVEQVARISGAQRKGACYRPDGAEIAALYTRRSGEGIQGLVLRWDAISGRLLGETAVGGEALDVPHFDGEGLAWIAPDDANPSGRLVLFGKAIIDPASGASLGDTGVSDARAATAAGASSLLVRTSPKYDEAVVALRVE